MNATMTLNNDLNGVELSFKNKPEVDILTALKTNGFRWHKIKKVWYARQSEKTLALAEQINNNEVDSIANTTESVDNSKNQVLKQNKNNIMSLFERVQIDENINNTDTIKSRNGKEIAVIVRKHIKERFPECKFSITSDYNSVSIRLKSSPYEYRKLAYSPEIETSEYRKFERENNKEVNAIIDYCEKYLKSFKYCTCYDPYGDYGSSYNFYDSTQMDYDYMQTEQTEETKKEIENFRVALIEQERQEEIKRDVEIEQAIKQQEIENEAAKIRHEQEVKNHDYIVENAKVIDLTDENQYMLFNVQMANCNKMQYLQEYMEQIEKNEFYLKDIKVMREIHFSNADALKLFNNMLLSDFDFLLNTGGSYTDDPRINNMIDYQNMLSNEQETVKFNLYGVGIYLDNILQYVIDTQGFSYARYVGLIDNAERGEIKLANTFTDENAINNAKINAAMLEDKSTKIITDLNLSNNEWETSAEYKAQIKVITKTINGGLTKDIIQQITIEELKVYLYRLLTEINSVQEQFTNSELVDGMRFTAFSIGSMGMINTRKATFHSLELTSYAQYKDAVKVVMTPKRKRNRYYTHYHSEQCFILVEGWNDFPEDILWITEEHNGCITKSSKYLSCDHQQIKDIKNYILQQNIKILVDRSEN